MVRHPWAEEHHPCRMVCVYRQVILMMLEAAGSIALAALVIARAINILK
jgi:hypothetical protein